MSEKFEQVEPGQEVTPTMTGYRMQCCDCGLIHAVDFRIVRIISGDPDGAFKAEPVDDPRYRVVLSAVREVQDD